MSLYPRNARLLFVQSGSACVQFAQVWLSRRRRPTTMSSNDTLVDTPFQLISDFFHVNQGVYCCEHAEQASSRGVLEGGGGATGLLLIKEGGATGFLV